MSSKKTICKGTTATGKNCSRVATTNGYCWQHVKQGWVKSTFDKDDRAIEVKYKKPREQTEEKNDDHKSAKVSENEKEASDHKKEPKQKTTKKIVKEKEQNKDTVATTETKKIEKPVAAAKKVEKPASEAKKADKSPTAAKKVEKPAAEAKKAKKSPTAVKNDEPEKKSATETKTKKNEPKTIQVSVVLGWDDTNDWNAKNLIVYGVFRDPKAAAKEMEKQAALILKAEEDASQTVYPLSIETRLSDKNKSKFYIWIAGPFTLAVENVKEVDKVYIFFYWDSFALKEEENSSKTFKIVEITTNKKDAIEWMDEAVQDYVKDQRNESGDLEENEIFEVKEEDFVQTAAGGQDAFYWIATKTLV